MPVDRFFGLGRVTDGAADALRLGWTATVLEPSINTSAVSKSPTLALSESTQPPFSNVRPPRLSLGPLLLALRLAGRAVPASVSDATAPATTPAALKVRKWRRDSLPSLDTSASGSCIAAGCVP